MKPIVRWTLGPTRCPEAIECLQNSIKYFQHFYKDKFDYFVMNNSHHKFNCNAVVIDQKKYKNDLKFPAVGPAWKLFPARLRQESHEIFIDNDLILHEKHPVIDLFLRSNNMIFCTEGYAKRFGVFQNLITKNIKLNSGFFGLPPHFDFKARIEEVVSMFDLPPFFDFKYELEHRHKKLGHTKMFFDGFSRYDEQGCVSLILSNHSNFKLVSIKDISVCVDKFKIGLFGIHFVGLNAGRKIFYDEYKKKHFLKI